MKKLLALLALCPAFASAGEYWGSVNLFSYHGDTQKKLNERNLGLGIEYHQTEEILYMAGAYNNSHRRTSVYLLAGWRPIEWGPLRMGLVGGLINGYPNHNKGKVIPAAAALVSWEGERWGANMLIIPAALKHTPVTLGFQMKYRF